MHKVPEWGAVRTALAAAGHATAEEPVRSIDDGAYSNAARWIVQLDDGSTAFAKASCDADAGVAREIAICGAQLGAFVPRLLGAVNGSEPDSLTVLLAEDLSHAHWDIPLTETDVRALRVALDQLAAVAAPAWVEAPSSAGVSSSHGWPSLAERTDDMLSLGMFSHDWLAAALPALVGAERTFDPIGTCIVHGDLWRQNWCIADRGAVIVDWTGTRLGSAHVNTAWAECAVRAAGGPSGIVVERSDPTHAEGAAFMASVTLRYLLHDHPVRTERPRLWETQLREAFAALRWAGEALDLPPLDPAPGVEPSGSWRP